MALGSLLSVNGLVFGCYPLFCKLSFSFYSWATVMCSFHHQIFMFRKNLGMISWSKIFFTLMFFCLYIQVLLDDVKVSEQLLDLVFYLLIVLSGYGQVFVNTFFWGFTSQTLNVYEGYFCYVGKSYFMFSVTCAFSTGSIQSTFIVRMYIFAMARSCSSIACSSQGTIFRHDFEYLREMGWLYSWDHCKLFFFCWENEILIGWALLFLTINGLIFIFLNRFFNF